MRHGGGLSTDFVALCEERLRGRACGAGSGTAAVPGSAAAAEDALPWPARRPVEEEEFEGFRPAADETAEQAGRRTLDALAQLARTMAQVGGTKVGAGTFNPLLPAGYTYLGQFIAHDMVFTASSPLDSGIPGRNLRSRALMLEALYGAGPEAAPWLYEPGERPDDPRSRLRLGRSVPAGGHPATFGDVPRVDSGCPASATARPGRTLDPLIGDQRNDDNLVLSQLLVTFHKVHNRLVAELEGPLPEGQARRDRWDVLRRRFEIARLLTTHAYRRIVVEDFLPRVLRCDVLGRHMARYRCATSDPERRRRAMESPDFVSQVPPEFSMAAFRFGHVMVAPSYHFSDRQPRSAADLERLLEFARDGSEGLLPLGDDWIIDWRFFFFETDGSIVPDSAQSLNFARLIRPAVAIRMRLHDTLASDDEREGGLVYRTLARGLSSGLWHGRALARAIGARDVLGQDEIAALLRRYSELAGAGQTLGPDAIDMLAERTPLFLYVLAEADLREGGHRLGELGSEIVARVVIDQLIATHADLPPWAEEHLHLLGHLDGSPTMRALTAFSGHAPPEH